MGALEERQIVARHPAQGTVVTRIDRPDPLLVKRYRSLYTAIVLDHMGKFGGMHQELKPVDAGMRVCGPAVTALGPDITVRRMAIDLAEPGDVLVVAAGGVRDYACFGDGTARRMQVKGLEGAVVDGAVRDVAGIRTLGFPTFSRGVTARNYHYPVSGEYGGVNVPVVCGNVLVHPGDLVLADDDGVVVVPREHVAAMIDMIEEHFEVETRERASWDRYVPFDVEAELRERGYAFR